MKTTPLQDGVVLFIESLRALLLWLVFLWVQRERVYPWVQWERVYLWVPQWVAGKWGWGSWLGVPSEWEY